jgi:hypothetical protein
MSSEIYSTNPLLTYKEMEALKDLAFSLPNMVDIFHCYPLDVKLKFVDYIIEFDILNKLPFTFTSRTKQFGSCSPKRIIYTCSTKLCFGYELIFISDSDSYLLCHDSGDYEHIYSQHGILERIYAEIYTNHLAQLRE